MENNKARFIFNAIKYGMLVTSYWAIMATFGGYMVTMAIARGYAEGIVSIICASYMLCVFGGQFFFGSMCDKLQNRKKVFIVGIILAAITQLGIYHFDSVLAFGILYSLFGFLMGPMGSVVDTWMLNGIGYDMKVYGIARGLSSAFYAIVSLVMGMAIDGIGFNVMPIASTVFVVITIGLSLISEDVFVKNGTGKESSGISLKDIFSIMKIPAFVLLVIVVFLIGMVNSPLNSLKIVILQSVGGSASTLGFDTFFGCMLQFILFTMTGIFSVIPAKNRLLITALAICMASVVDFFATAPWMVIVGTLFMNVHYSFLMPALRETIRNTVDIKYQTTANGVADAFYGSLSGAVSLLYAGTLAENYGAKIMVLSCLLISAFPVGIMILRCRKDSEI